jgi:predicted transcriptional regulator
MVHEMANVPLYGQRREASEVQASSPMMEAKRKVLARRSQLEIRMDMLKVIKEGAEKPTQIMYKANLSWVALQTHLTQMIERGLLIWVTEGTRKRYELTLKGSSVMYAYRKILEEVGEDEVVDFVTAF